MSIITGSGIGVPSQDVEPAENPGFVSKDIPFKLSAYENNLSFGPFFPPDRVRIKKERNVQKEDTLCEGQDVNDTGSKNRVIHVSGILRGYEEVRAMDDILDYGKPLEMDTMGHAWEGKVLLENGQYEGPVGKDQQNPNLFHWQYSMDLVSTGLDEYSEEFDDGIISEG